MFALGLAASASAHAQPLPVDPAAPTSAPASTPESQPTDTVATAPEAPAPAAPTPPPYVPPVMPAYGWGPAPAPSAAPALAPRRAGRIGTANSDRVVLLPTAYTHPEGTLYLSSNELILLQVGYAVSDSTQITLTGTPPLGERDKVMLVDLSLKNAFVREGPLRLAAIGSMSGVLGVDLGNFVIGRVGAVAELCFDARCESSASVSSNVMLAGPGTVMVNGAGVVWRLSRGAALLLEADTLVPIGGEVGEYSGVAVFGGFRFPYESWSLDLALGRGLDTEDPPDPAVVPWIAFTYRFLP